MAENYLVLCWGQEEKKAVAFDHDSLDDAMLAYDILQHHPNYSQVDLVQVLESSNNGELRSEKQ